jgi:hypothetical protein
MFYDEVRDRLAAMDILTPAQTQEQQRLLRALPALPAESLAVAWGTYYAVCEA